MEYINELLARVHYLNNPFVTFVASLSLIFMGTYVLSKNPRSALYRSFFFLNFVTFLWFIGNVVSMLGYRNIDIGILGHRIGYSGVCFMVAAYYTFYYVQFHKGKFFMYLLYVIGLLELVYLWTTKDSSVGARALYNVGAYWEGMPRFSYFLAFGMIKYFIIAWITAACFWKEYRKETIPFKKNQFRSLAIVVAVFSFGWTEWMVSFGIKLHIAWMLIPIFVGTMGYSIIHYRTMEIDTVIHRTILWLAVSGFILLPLGALTYLMRAWFHDLNWTQLTMILTLMFYLFLFYYLRMQPRIDHFFRRRKYDYQAVLGMVAEKIATTINIEDLTRQLLTEVCETMYLRNSLLYVLNKNEAGYSIIGRRGYKEIDGIRQRVALEIFSEEEKIHLSQGTREIGCNTALSKWFSGHSDILEKGQVEVDPQYEAIKEEALACFKEHDVEVIVPLVVQDKVNAILGLGKKENLQAYSEKDLELLRKLGQEVGVTVFNALHYQDLAEKQRLDEEMRMGRQIQVNLLPQRTPQIEGLIVQGLMNPAKEIGGDYYDFISLSGRDELGIVIGDVSGKGVAAGLLMTMAKMAIHALSQQENSPRRILVKANSLLYDQIGGQKFMTLLYLLWQAKSKTLLYSSAGHEHILIFRHQAQVIEAIQSGGFMLGMMPEIDVFLEETHIPFENKDKILLYTDGVTEAQNASGDRFSLSKLKEVFMKHSAKPAAELMQSVKEDVYSFIGEHPQYDDIT
ncbi:MAG: SpoIIE family protein phosphatase, partial [Candidatus Omnitrophica bacterium]|nr:SpoIIE family protein phosphatase [Candidatus Omnitrophota bacterium]